MDIKDALAEEDYISGTQSPAEDYGVNHHHHAAMLENQEAGDLQPDDFSPQTDFSEQATPTVEFPVAIRA